ncbi:hypothetical protein EGI16_03030 [Chryseobacterium sp. G0240]|uniref:hypothetical protein n=1 Tax=Chryseobacterium sp. G0240 TaxID=2487066 RepID=UPI000F451F3A|nr:hypothetical protein [Chryseobacterium sp. G0240]ROI06892.1 hypothetical protein EGI16_03030 [Chryseobacterium sp. G0240]
MKSLLLSFSLVSTCVFSQVAIGKTAVTNNSVSLEFGNANKGMILPWVTFVGSVSGAVNGTLVYDLTDHKVKVKYASNWKDLSIDTTGTTVDPVTNINGVNIQTSAPEQSTAKTSIGTPTATPGILVLEASNRAMILPKVPNPHLNIVNPSPGMIVYDTNLKLFAVFNGKVWSFWN